MKSVADLHEARLIVAVANGRKLLLTLLLFATAIVGAGAVRLNQAQSINAEARQLKRTLPASWEPLEGFYNQSGYLLSDFAEKHSTPWSQGYFTIITYLVALQHLNKNPTIDRSVERVGELGRALHQYNSDIRTIAAAQRRNLSLRQLSKRELEALERIASHKFTAGQKMTLKDTPKTAQMILRLSNYFQAQPNFSKTDVGRLLQLRGPRARMILQSLIDNPKWSDVETELLFSDVYGASAKGTAVEYASLRKSIAALPNTSIAAADERLAKILAQQKALDMDAGLAIPILGIRVAAAHVIMAAGIINVLLVLTFCVQQRSSLAELGGLQTAAPDQARQAHLLMVRDTTFLPGERMRAAFLVLCLVSPSIAALGLFGGDELSFVTLMVSAFILLLVIAATAFAMSLSRELAKAASAAATIV